PSTGEKISQKGNLAWQEVFGKTLVELAEKNETICGITAAMPSGTSMSIMQEAFPKRTFDVGISEGHAVTFAGGLAAAGKKPFVAIYSSFLQRAYDNIIHDVAIQGLPVVFCIDRAGIVGEDGVTHHGLFDLAYLRTIPNMTVASPMDASTLRNLMKTAEVSSAPFAIRYPRGKSESSILDPEIKELRKGEGRKIFTSKGTGHKVAILTIGPVGTEAIDAAKKLEKDGIRADVFDMIWVKPLDMDILNRVAKDYSLIVTVEDGVKNGGFGSAVLEALSSLKLNTPLMRLGAPDAWVTHGSVAELRAECGFDSDGIRQQILNEVSVLSVKE
ncbi:MAG: 1-deoxy-D-xylulose-5-phosphate synthase, partial [Muribaculaceae bacterium]|nr:1-deoxy-D-xylulose-5-phosphate synthase [Muribaculaceae bacterium]